MNIIHCINSHYYDSDAYPACPHCVPGVAKNAAPPKGRGGAAGAEPPRAQNPVPGAQNARNPVPGTQWGQNAAQGAQWGRNPVPQNYAQNPGKVPSPASQPPRNDNFTETLKQEGVNPRPATPEGEGLFTRATSLDGSGMSPTQNPTPGGSRKTVSMFQGNSQTIPSQQAAAQQGYPQRQTGARGYPQQGTAAQGYPQQGGPQPVKARPVVPQQGTGAQGHPQQQAAAQGYPQQQAAAQGYPQQQAAAQGYPQQQSAAQGYPQQQAAAQGHPQQQATAQGYPQQQAAAQGHPQQQAAAQGYPQQQNAQQGGTQSVNNQKSAAQTGASAVKEQMLDMNAALSTNPQMKKPEASGSVSESLTEMVERVSTVAEGRTMSYFSVASKSQGNKASGSVQEAAAPAGSEGTNTAAGSSEEFIEPVVGWLVCMAGPNIGRDYRICSGSNSIGRGASNRINVTGDDTISREKHAMVIYEPTQRCFFLKPGDSSGLTYLNGEYIAERVNLSSGDMIGLGQSQFMFVPLCWEKFGWETLLKG